MDIDYLLIILPIIVCLGLFGLILFIWQYRGDHTKKNREKDAARVKAEPLTESLPEKTEELERREPILTTLETEKIAMEPEVSPPDFNEHATASTPQTIENQKESTNETLFVFHLLAHPDRPYTGYELLQSISSAGFHYGAMNIFHYHVDHDKEKPRLFSLAQSVEPGTFDLDHVAEMQCPGLCLFMSIPTSEQTAERFEQLLDTAQTLLQDLGGTLCDQQRRPLTSQQLEAYRSQFLSYA
jgi:cell division protein ZipA